MTTMQTEPEIKRVLNPLIPLITKVFMSTEAWQIMSHVNLACNVIYHIQRIQTATLYNKYYVYLIISHHDLESARLWAAYRL